MSGISGINAGYQGYDGEIKENSTKNIQTTISAQDEIKTKSGQDTTLKGASIRGDKVTMEAAGNLNLESQKDTNIYKEKTTSGGISISTSIAKGKLVGSGVQGGISQGKTDSTYEGVTEQTGIYAGEKGFDITCCPAH